MPAQPRMSSRALISRWLVGMGLISWRYLWATTPLHRTEELVEESGTAPDVPPGSAIAELQHWRSGVGPLYHRTFRVRIVHGRYDARALMATVIGDLGRLVPQEVVHVHEGEAADRRLRVGDQLVVDMPGPWNGPVQVVDVDDRRLQLATLAGHLEAGHITFSAEDGRDGEVLFEIDAWARAATRAVHLLYSRLRLAKEIQLNMWVRFCLAAAADARGRVADGVTIRTDVIPVG